jgi:hypothetical protein
MRAITPFLALNVFVGIWPPLPSQAQATAEMTSVQIVNATSVPLLSLKINDTLAYDTFRQGTRSGDAAVPLLEAVYEAEDKRSGSKAKSDKITYQPGAYQSLVILGDFSATSPRTFLRQPASALGREHGKPSPNVLFQVYPHTPSKVPVRLRIINGMPAKNLTFVNGKNEVVIRPGECAILESQPATAQYTAHVDGESISLLMRQEGLIRNAIIAFFLKDGKPTFIRAFENNAESKAMRAELEKARE